MRSHRLAVLVTAVTLGACQVNPPAPAQNPPPPAPVVSITAAAPPSPEVAASAPAPPPPAETPTPGRAAHPFDDDVAFLAQHGAGVRVLESPSGGRIAISGKYQARVLTSALEPHGASLGFVNRSFVEAGKTGTQFDNYGGEDRFWLGPEGGQYALYFAPGAAFEFGNWQTPHAFQEGEWQERASTPTSVTFSRAFTVTNYAKSEFKLEVERKLTLLSAEAARTALGLELPQELKWVGFSSENSLFNRGKQAWTESKGLPSVWILGMFNPAPGTRIVLPFEKQGSGVVVNDSYFGKVPADRLHIVQDKGFALFKADGQARGKVGLSATRAKSVLGSYSAEAHLLTIVRFNKPAGALRYVNNSWAVTKEPYAGDVSNAYNDGPVEPGKPSLGGFYELESSSPAAALAPGGKLLHTHETYHFAGPRDALERIAVKVLGVSLSDIEGAAL